MFLFSDSIFRSLGSGVRAILSFLFVPALSDSLLQWHLKCIVDAPVVVGMPWMGSSSGPAATLASAVAVMHSYWSPSFVCPRCCTDEVSGALLVAKTIGEI